MGSSMSSGSRLVGAWCVLEVTAATKSARLAAPVGLARGGCARVSRPLRVRLEPKIRAPHRLRRRGPTHAFACVSKGRRTHARAAAPIQRVRLVSLIRALALSLHGLGNWGYAEATGPVGIYYPDGRCVHLGGCWLVVVFSFLFVNPCARWLCFALADANGFLAPPSSVLRLNPSVWIPKEDEHLRSPFQATSPCDLAMLPWRLLSRGGI